MAVAGVVPLVVPLVRRALRQPTLQRGGRRRMVVGVRRKVPMAREVPLVAPAWQAVLVLRGAVPMGVMEGTERPREALLEVAAAVPGTTGAVVALPPWSLHLARRLVVAEGPPIRRVPPRPSAPLVPQVTAVS